jgi:hypothetical protein
VRNPHRRTEKMNKEIKISECKINDKNHLIDQENKLIVVQIGKFLFCLDYLRKINLDEIKEVLNTYNLVLLQEGN